MGDWTAFLEDRWYVALAALVVALIVVRLVRTVVRWVIIVAIAAGLLWYGGQYVDRLKETGAQAVATVRDEALKRLAGADASYRDNGDGTFTVTAGDVRIDGTKGAGEVKITYKGVSFTVPVEGAVKTVIDRASPR